jgi:hypothetical protein
MRTIRITIIGASLALIAATTAKADDLFPHARWVRSATNEVKCLQSKRGFVFDTRGPCPKFVRPDRVAIGNTFQVDGQVIPINVIDVMRDDDHTVPDSGGTLCAAASDRQQMPAYNDSTVDGIWLIIPHCVPIQ